MRRPDDGTWMEIAAWIALAAFYVVAGIAIVQDFTAYGFLLILAPLGLVQVISRHGERSEDRIYRKQRAHRFDD